MHSRNGPGIAVSDVNADGLEDFYIGGASNHSGALYLQQGNGKFKKGTTTSIDSAADDMGVLFFDADGDGDVICMLRAEDRSKKRIRPFTRMNCT